MKRGRLLSVLGLITLVLISAYLVSAQSPIEDLSSLWTGIKDALTTLFEQILGPGPEGNVAGELTSFLWARVLFLLIVFVIVWGVIKTIPFFEANTWMMVIISGAVSLLSTRFLLQSEWISVILLPYSVFGVAVTALLPLVIYFFFVEGMNSEFLRKTMWIFAAIVFIGLWWSRYSELKSIALYVYPVAALACLICFAFDGTIRQAFNRIKVKKSLNATQYALYGKYMDQINELMAAQKHFVNDSQKYKDVQNHIDNLIKKVSEMTTT